MSAILPFGGASVMQRRVEPPDSLDLFPTPPWSTRALLTHVLWPTWIEGCSVWEPAVGLGHMSAVLEEFFARVIATDVFDYSGGNPARWPAAWWRTLDLLDDTETTPVVDWAITNPPFKTAEQFALRLIPLAEVGVALLVRSAWLEGTGRYERLFRPHPPSIVAQFCERVPMTKGRWDPDASTATAYCWVVWLAKPLWPGTRFEWIPPGQRVALTKPDDAVRFGVKVEGALL